MKINKKLHPKKRRFVAHNKTVGCQSVRTVAVLCKTSLYNSELSSLVKVALLST